MRPRVTWAGLALCVQCAAAARASDDRPDWQRPALQHGARVVASSDTYLRIFERALLPGPNGAVIDSRTQAPLHEYLSVRASDLEPPWGSGQLEAQVSAWGSLVFGEAPNHRLDADVTTAFVHQRWRRFHLRVGRQSVSAGAARYVRFDGVLGGVRPDAPLGLDAYAGFSVLPRWDAHAGYQYLGSAREALVKNSELFERPGRAGNWLGGGRLYFDVPGVALGVSFHEERESNELARRNLGFDLALDLGDAWRVSGNTSVDTDSWALADARVWLDVAATQRLDASIEYLHTDPSLFLSRNSVLSVFGTSELDEVGAELSYGPLRQLSGSLGAYAQRAAGELGARSEARLRAVLGESERLLLQVSHARLISEANGYHALRGSGRYQISSALSGSGEMYVYFYDESIAGRRYSLVETASLAYQLSQPWSLLCAASLVQSPYARADVQALARVSYRFDPR